MKGNSFRGLTDFPIVELWQDRFFVVSNCKVVILLPYFSCPRCTDKVEKLFWDFIGFYSTKQTRSVILFDNFIES